MSLENKQFKIIAIENLEGIQFGVYYFDAQPPEIYVSPSVFKKLQSGDLKHLQYVQMSWPSQGRDIHEDAKILVEEFKKMPPGEVSFDAQSEQERFDSERTGQRRIIQSPKWEPN